MSENDDDEIKAIRKRKEEMLKKIITMPSGLVHVHTVADFNKLIEDYKDQIIVMDFWAEWCAPCKMFSPIFEQAQKKWGTEFVFVKVNTEEVPGISQALGVEGIPMLIFVKNKKEIGRQAGALRRNQFEQLLQKAKGASQNQSRNDSSMYS